MLVFNIEPEIFSESEGIRLSYHCTLLESDLEDSCDFSVVMNRYEELKNER